MAIWNQGVKKSARQQKNVNFNQAQKVRTEERKEEAPSFLSKPAGEWRWSVTAYLQNQLQILFPLLPKPHDP